MENQDAKRIAVESIELTNHKHFPHIDGLRALAIIPVVIYHIAEALCPGGYTGVDVFFVISGYLITMGIVSNLGKGTFTIKDFYFRRIRRIIPAYFALIIVVLAVFLFVYVFARFKSIAAAGLYSAFYCVNIYFANNRGYFDFENRGNPLLHLWSLSVEEQFYFFAPVFFLIVWKFGRRFFLPILTVVLGLSFLISALAIHRGAENFAFYMLPSRAWELLVGSLASQMVFREGSRGWWRSMAAILGVALIFFPYVCYTDNTAFPGPAALPSVLGAALLLLFGNEGPVKWVLSWGPLAFVGRISYSLYLWHWPVVVLVFLYVHSFRLGVTLLISVVLAYLSYRFVELPFRKNKNFTPRQAYLLLLSGTALIMAFCFWLTVKKSRIEGVPLSFHGQPTWRSFGDSRDERRAECTVEELKSGTALISIGATDRPPTFVLWGDSHGLALLEGLDAVARENKAAGVFVNRQHSLSGDDAGSSEYREPVLEWLESQKSITDVYLVNRWLLRLRNESDVAMVAELCARLRRAGKNVFLLQNPPEAKEAALRDFEWNRTISDEEGSMSKSEYEARAKLQRQLVDQLTAQKLATVVPLNMAFFDGTSYRTVTTEECYFSDSNHLSTAGALRALRYAAPYLWEKPEPPAVK